jgi:thiamine transport system ATP-binding protein
VVTQPPDGRCGLEVDDVRVTFGDTVAVDALSLEVAPGEIVAVLGPSGCGKSTLLRVIAGLQSPDRGSVRWDGADITRAPPHERNFGLMFQDHALFPHRDVRGNVEFGLRMQRVDAGARRARVDALLDLVGLHGFGDRTIDTLSGGEAQRVALARALAPAPRLLMLDEPLGSLDRALRDRLARDLREVLQVLGQSAMHVTHDQDEAFDVADRLVVMSSGRIERVGAPIDVWSDPQREFVARFLGHENVLDAATARALSLGDGSHAVVVPDRAIRVGSGAPIEHPGFDALVRATRFRGAAWRIELELRGPDAEHRAEPLSLVWRSSDPPPVGTRVRVAIDRALVRPVA